MRPLLSLSAAVLLACALPAQAQPVLDTGMTPAQARARLGLLGLAQQIVLPRNDGLRAVRVNIVVPPGPAPASGWPVLFLLDGNATLQALVDGGKPAAAVLVGIGYDVDTRLDVVSRAWDYTPEPPANLAPEGRDPRQPGRRNGGADAWLELIEQRVKPLVKSAAPIDATRQTLYGHSYGGLFVLHALRTRPAAFQRYVAASPSLWWHEPFMADRLAGLDTAGCCATAPRQLYLWVGAEERSRPAPALNGPGAAQERQAPGAGGSRAADLARALDGRPGLQVLYRSYAGLGHGAMLPVSARAAAQVAARPAQAAPPADQPKRPVM